MSRSSAEANIFASWKSVLLLFCSFREIKRKKPLLLARKERTRTGNLVFRDITVGCTWITSAKMYRIDIHYRNPSVSSRNIFTLEILSPKKELTGQVPWFSSITWHLSALGSRYLIDSGLPAPAHGSWEAGKIDERCRTVPSRAGELRFAQVCASPSRSRRKAQDTTGTSTPLSLLHAADGKRFPCSCLHQPRRSHKASRPRTRPAHRPPQVRGCKCLEKKGKYRLVPPFYTPTLSLLLVYPLHGSWWCVCTNTTGTCASLQLGMCCLFPSL